MFYLHCHKGDKIARIVETSEFSEAVNAAEENKSATAFELFSHEWPDHHLQAEVKPNGHLDWVRTKY